MTQQERDQLEFFRMRGSTFLMASAIAACLEAFMGSQVPNRFRLHFRNNPSPQTAEEKWAKIIEAASSFSTHLQLGLSDGINNQTKVKEAMSNFAKLVNATKQANSDIYAKFAAGIGQ